MTFLGNFKIAISLTSDARQYVRFTLPAKLVQKALRMAVNETNNQQDSRYDEKDRDYQAQRK